MGKKQTGNSVRPALLATEALENKANGKSAVKAQGMDGAWFTWSDWGTRTDGKGQPREQRHF